MFKRVYSLWGYSEEPAACPVNTPKAPINESWEFLENDKKTTKTINIYAQSEPETEPLDPATEKRQRKMKKRLAKHIASKVLPTGTIKLPHKKKITCRKNPYTAPEKQVQEDTNNNSTDLMTNSVYVNKDKMKNVRYNRCKSRGRSQVRMNVNQPGARGGC